MSTTPKPLPAAIRELVAKVVNEAALAERERCAEICVARSKEHVSSKQHWEDEDSINQCIQDAIEALACATAIRKGGA